MKKYIVAIDQSTSASKVFLTDSGAKILRRFSKPHKQYYPEGGGAEHDAEEIWQNVLEGINTVIDGIDPDEIAAISICNQRETTAFFERSSGKPIRNAVVWQDVRSEGLLKQLSDGADLVKDVTGLALSPYYPAGKILYVIENDKPTAERIQSGDGLIGTIDSYLIYRLTGGRRFCQDISNASRTQLFDIRKKAYSQELCRLFGIPIGCLPDVLPSDGEFGETAVDGIPAGIPIRGVMGDSHASLFAQGCIKAGMAKTSYGTGSSVMMNTGKTAVTSKNGLSTSIAYGFMGETEYVLEGNITHSGDSIKWLCEEAEMADNPQNAEQIALRVPSSGGVYLIPAFSGMGAPYFDTSARAAFIGMNRSTTRAHMVRAAIESMAYQNADVILSMQNDMGKPLNILNADGGGCRNEMLMQLQADLLQCPVKAAYETELSALGSAMMAGESLGLYDISELNAIDTRLYTPKISSGERDKLIDGWRNAVRRILG